MLQALGCFQVIAQASTFAADCIAHEDLAHEDLAHEDIVVQHLFGL
jgi:hypothetical protein